MKRFVLKIFAFSAYYGVGCLEEAERVLNTLAMNSVALNKYEDASHFFWLFAKHRLQLAAKALAIPFLQKLSE
jgi:intraflagellar transport protein 122